MDRVAWIVSALFFVGCAGGDDDETAGDSAITSAADDDDGATLGMTSAADDATTAGSTATSGDVDCDNVQIPGCEMVVEVCQAGACECLCADPAGTDEGGECPPILPAGPCEASCDQIGLEVMCSATCCVCAPHDAERNLYWACAENDSVCPATEPALTCPR